MLGNNPKRGPEKGDGSWLYVKSIFKTIQGEGPNAGTPAIFIRLGGCNLACSFCDTDFEDFDKVQTQELVNRVKNDSLNSKREKSVNLVVITGGEPLRQEISFLCKKLLERGFEVQIETNGTLFRELPKEVQIICSPKVSGGKYISVREDLLKRINAFKFLISTNITEYSQVPNLGQDKYNIPVYVQAMDEYDSKKNAKNKQKTVEIAIENGYRLSYQIHKELGIE